eukprot:NODE_238_length_13323_cov_0.463854.p8 type:complete len:121 gc:universal NODE_238_length_13323_cov_0.463854:12709-13071(+)
MDAKRLWIWILLIELPFKRYLVLFGSEQTRVMVISSKLSKPIGLLVLSWLLNIKETEARLTCAFPCLYIKSLKCVHLIRDKSLQPITKVIASSILDFPLPFRPDIQLKFAENGPMVVLPL